MTEHNNHGKNRCRWGCGCGGLGWGIFLLIFGGYFLAQDLGFISGDISFWPVLLVGFGAYIVIKSLTR